MNSTPPSPGGADPVLDRRIHALCEEGRDFCHDFDVRVRQDHWHPFVAADYDNVRNALMPLRGPGRRFLEWGSANGVITVMADLLGFDASGIEIDPGLVASATALAERTESNARFVAGSFLPLGWEWNPDDGDRRTGTIDEGPSGYLQLGRALDDFHVVCGYPWPGEEAMMLDLMRCHGHADAVLLLYDAERGVVTYRNGVEVATALVG